MNELYTYLVEVGDSIGVEFYAVGGSVRDEYLGIPTSDYDVVARGLPEEELIAALGKHGRVERTGTVFGVIRYFPKHRHLPMVEVALPRKELSVGFSHQDFEVEFDHTLPIEEDLLRRDFTVNAIARNLKTGEVLDPTGGLADLKAGILRVISDTSAQDDPLRVFRAIRFIAKLGFTVDPETDTQLREAATKIVESTDYDTQEVHEEYLLSTVSAERFQAELLKMVTEPHIAKALRYAQEIGALYVVLPELDRCAGCTQNSWHTLDVFEHTLLVVQNTPSDDPYVKLAALFHDIGKPPTKWVGRAIPLDPKAPLPEIDGHFYQYDLAQSEVVEEAEINGAHEEVGADIAYRIMNRLKFSAHAATRVSLLVREHMFSQGERLSNRAARRFLARLANTPGGVEANAEALFAIRWGDLHAGKENAEWVGYNVRFALQVYRELANDAATTVRDLALNGHDLMGLGLVGVDIGIAQKRLLEAVLDNPDVNTPEGLKALL